MTYTDESDVMHALNVEISEQRAELERLRERNGELERREKLRTGNLLDQSHAELAARLHRIEEAAREAEKLLSQYLRLAAPTTPALATLVALRAALLGEEA